jgi:hypothetical protein
MSPAVEYSIDQSHRLELCRMPQQIGSLVVAYGIALDVYISHYNISTAESITHIHLIYNNI